MRKKEYFHTAESYRNAGIDPFVQHAKQYLEGKRTVPVSRTRSIHNKDITFTFSNNLLERFVNNLSSIEKPYEVAIKYGFQGYSRGEKNGILLVREEKKEGRLVKATDSLIERNSPVLKEDLDLQKEGLDALKRVKIVWHEPSGKRIVGAYNTNNNRMMFLDFAYY